MSLVPDHRKLYCKCKLPQAVCTVFMECNSLIAIMWPSYPWNTFVNVSKLDCLVVSPLHFVTLHGSSPGYTQNRCPGRHRAQDPIQDY